MHYLKDPIVLALLMLVSLGALKWCGRTIIEAVANARRVKVRLCDCGRLVQFNPPIKLPTKADLYAAAGTITTAMSAAEGIPLAGGGQIVLEDLPPVPAEIAAAMKACTSSDPCATCKLGGRVRCVRCTRDLGCHLEPTAMLCDGCKLPAAPPPPDAELVELSAR